MYCNSVNVYGIGYNHLIWQSFSDHDPAMFPVLSPTAAAHLPHILARLILSMPWTSRSSCKIFAGVSFI